jgi:hypothetical protein
MYMTSYASVNNRPRRWVQSVLACGISLSLLLPGWVCPPDVSAAGITAVWANEGGDKVTQDELRATTSAIAVRNSVWDGQTLALFGAKNEVVSFNLILEAAGGASNVSVSLNTLTGPNGRQITSTTATGDQVFSYVNRNIELFYVRYLPIKGLSLVSYGTYDERHVPQKLQRPWSGSGTGSGGWTNRPNHDKFYPEITVPLELVPTFNIASGHNQSIWGDIYIPKTIPAGLYTGTLTVREVGAITHQVPIQLTVRNITLPDMPSSKTMLFYSPGDINHRQLGTAYIDPSSAAGSQARVIRDRFAMLAHRHKISLIGDDSSHCANPGDQPCPEWVNRINGSLYTAANGYDGPGVGVGNNVYSIGTYGAWSWQSGGQSAMNTHSDAWVNWFTANAPGTDYFLYLIDESPNTAQIQQWANWIVTNPGPGSRLKSMATIDLPTAASACPALDVPTSTLSVGISSEWQPLNDRYTADARKRFYMYNGHRPATGSFATEDDGVALRELAWAQYKKKINRWFFWAATYYNNYQGGMGETNVYRQAMTFGTNSSVDSSIGQTGWNYSNGDGVLAYPGTDTLFPADSYGVNGLFAGLRMKEWRRGIQDVDYLTMAAAINPTAVQTLVNTMVPQALWDYGVSNPSDPTYVRSNISWSVSPDVWESARRQLADIIDTGGVVTLPAAPTGVTANSQDGSAVVAWTPVVGATSYSIYYKVGTGVTPSNGTALRGAISPAAVASLSNGQLYSFIVTASNAAGESPASAEIDATPVASAIPLPTQPVFVNLKSQYPMSANMEARSSNADKLNFTFTRRAPGSPPFAASALGPESSVSATSPSGKLEFKDIPGLTPGFYHVVVTGQNKAGLSPATQTDLILVAPAGSVPARIRPNPWRADQHNGNPVTFDQLNPNSNVKVFTVSGHLVRSLDAPAGSVSWDLKNASGDRVASGLYLYLITSGSSHLRGKLAVIH